MERNLNAPLRAIYILAGTGVLLYSVLLRMSLPRISWVAGIVIGVLLIGAGGTGL